MVKVQRNFEYKLSACHSISAAGLRPPQGYGLADIYSHLIHAQGNREGYPYS